MTNKFKIIFKNIYDIFVEILLNVEYFLCEIKNTSIKLKWYSIGLFLFLIALFLLKLNIAWYYFFTVLLVGEFFLVLGLLFENQNEIDKLLNNFYIKKFIIIYHVGILVVAGVSAKSIISKAIGLPAGDFPATLATLTMLESIFFWIMLAALFIYILSIIKIGKQKKFINEIILLIISIISPSILFVIAAVEGGLVEEQRLVRLFAYWADYDRAACYPGVESKPFKLHDNGVVSYAKLQNEDATLGKTKFVLKLLWDGNVEITVGRINNSDSICSTNYFSGGK